MNAKDTDLIHEVITLLVNLTIPVECLMSVEVMRRTEIGRHTIYDLTNLLVSAKEAFANPLATKTLVNRMQMIFDSEATLSVVDCGKINHCLVLLRNILHVSEGQLNEDTSLQNRIIWNLFTQSIDKLILHIINSEQCEFWAVTVTQLIALLYKDQHVNTMQKLLNVWFEASLSESSEDDYESSSSLSMQFRGGSSPMLTSEPTSDSSDIGDSTLSSPNKSKLQKLKGNCFRKPAPNASDDKQVSHTIESQNSLDEEMPRDMQPPPRKDSGATETSITQLSSSGFGSMEEQSMSDSDQQMMVNLIKIKLTFSHVTNIVSFYYLSSLSHRMPAQLWPIITIMAPTQSQLETMVMVLLYRGKSIKLEVLQSIKPKRRKCKLNWSYLIGVKRLRRIIKIQFQHQVTK